MKDDGQHQKKAVQHGQGVYLLRLERSSELPKDNSSERGVLHEPDGRKFVR